jgi:hypothetical protein
MDGEKRAQTELEEAVKRYPEEDFPNGGWFKKLSEVTGIPHQELGAELLALGYYEGAC